MREQPGRLYELDILRGIAAIFMGVNHIGVNLIPHSEAKSGLIGALVFLGSYAPALFFFITGVGYGLKDASVRYFPCLYKAFVLIVADRFFVVGIKSIVGIDFLGFIGLSMIVLAFIQNRKKNIEFAVCLLMVITIGKFIADPLTNWIEKNNDQSLFWLPYFLGSKGIKGFAYPIFPWLALPLIGFVFGKYLNSQSNREKVKGVLVIVFGISSLMVLALAVYGASFFRWGIMSKGYYISCFAVLSASWLFVSLLVKISSTRVQRAISLKGVSSFAFVPIHYAIIHVLSILGFKIEGFFQVFVFSLIFLFVCFYLSKTFDDLLKKYKRRSIWQIGGVWGIVLSLFIYGILDTQVAYLIRTVGQLLCSSLLVSVSRSELPQKRTSYNNL